MPVPIEEYSSEEEMGSDTVEEIKENDIFKKESESVVIQKVAMARQLQQSLQKSEKWMWAFNKERKFLPFLRPKRTLEQYITPVEDACTIGYILQEALNDKTFADLGAGPGGLGIVCLLAGAKKVHFYEIDGDAFTILQRNCKAIIDNEDVDEYGELESSEEQVEISIDPKTGDSAKDNIKPQIYMEPIETSRYRLVNCDLLNPTIPFSEVDGVIMNPPFGTSKDEGLDLEFLQVGCKMTRGSIFFIHKLARTKVLSTITADSKQKCSFLWQETKDTLGVFA